MGGLVAFLVAAFTGGLVLGALLWRGEAAAPIATEAAAPTAAAKSPVYGARGRTGARARGGARGRPTDADHRDDGARGRPADADHRDDGSCGRPPTPTTATTAPAVARRRRPSRTPPALAPVTAKPVHHVVAAAHPKPVAHKAPAASPKAGGRERDETGAKAGRRDEACGERQARACEARQDQEQDLGRSVRPE